MNQNDDGRLSLIVDFTVRHDKWRGVVIEKFATNANEYFFKYQDQSVNRHCEQIQKIVLEADVKRTKMIRVDISKFSYEYYRSGIATFKGCTLNSVNKQITKICELYINKEIGSIKRNTTVAQNKQRKIEEHNVSISSMMKSVDEYYEELRAMRLKQVFGDGDMGTPPRPPESPSSGSGNSENPLVIQESQSARVPPRIPVAAISPLIFIPPSIPPQNSDDELDFPMVDELGIPIEAMQQELDDEDF